MPLARPLAAVLLWSAVALAADGPPAHRVKGDRVIEARRILTTYCGGCHGEQTPRGRLKVFDHPAMSGHREPVSFLTQVIDLIEDGSMPPGLHKRPTAAEVKVLKEWVADGAPAYPKQFDDAAAAEAALAHFKTLEKFEQDGVRYVSFAHLANTPGEVAKAEQSLRDAIALPEPYLRPVGLAGTVFRLDIVPLGWHHQDLFVANDKAAVPDGKEPIIPFDLILLEYPYPVPPDQLGAGAVDAVKAMNAHKDLKPWNLFRPQLFLRGDWLAAALGTHEKPTPLGEDLAALKKYGDTPSKEERLKLEGPKPRPFTGPPPAKEGRAPLGSWVTKDAGEQPAWCKVARKLVGPPMADNPPFELYADCDRDAHLRLLAVFPGGEVVGKDLKESGTDQVKRGAKNFQLKSNEKGVFNINCKPGDLYYVLFAFEKPTDADGNRIEVLTVKSVHDHDKNPIHRFFPSDPSVPAVRLVIPITVK